MLKPDERVVLIAEAYRGRRADWLYRPAMRLLRAKYLTPENTDGRSRAQDTQISKYTPSLQRLVVRRRLQPKRRARA